MCDVTALNLRNVDRSLIYRARVAAMAQRVSLKEFVLGAIGGAVDAHDAAKAGTHKGSADKLTAAMPKIAAAARGPLHLQTASTLPPRERTYEPE